MPSNIQLSNINFDEFFAQRKSDIGAIRKAFFQIGKLIGSNIVGIQFLDDDDENSIAFQCQDVTIYFTLTVAHRDYQDGGYKGWIGNVLVTFKPSWSNEIRRASDVNFEITPDGKTNVENGSNSWFAVCNEDTAKQFVGSIAYSILVNHLHG